MAERADNATFRYVFAAVVLATGMIVGAMVLNSKRPKVEVRQPTAELIAASGKCAECHLHETSAIVHQFARSKHASNGVTCLDCHQPVDGQKSMEHSGFTIAEHLTAANCKQCHATEYDQYLRSRHAAAAWAAVAGDKDFTAEQVAFAEAMDKGSVERGANTLAIAEGAGVLTKGCYACHSIGKPNEDGTIGTCTACHSRHSTSVALARMPQTCGQCHMGPDHSQIEIYDESKHGVIFAHEQETMHLDADPDSLTTEDMPVPTCATCHMSGLENLKVTHNVGERLSYYLFAAVSDKRTDYLRNQQEMKEVCLKCHAQPSVDQFYAEAEEVVQSTNAKVAESLELMAGLRKEGLLTPEPYDEPIELVAFDMWHYFGRTAKHGAFMGGADFVQWHGNYELMAKMMEMKQMAAELRAGRAHAAAE